MWLAAILRGSLCACMYLRVRVLAVYAYHPQALLVHVLNMRAPCRVMLLRVDITHKLMSQRRPSKPILRDSLLTRGHRLLALAL
jgi:hypothetical protein